MTEGHIDQLTDDCLTAVLVRLPWEDRIVAETVCRRWNRVVLERGWSDYRCFDNHEWLKEEWVWGTKMVNWKSEDADRTRMLNKVGLPVIVSW